MSGFLCLTCYNHLQLELLAPFWPKMELNFLPIQNFNHNFLVSGGKIIKGLFDFLTMT